MQKLLQGKAAHRLILDSYANRIIQTESSQSALWVTDTPLDEIHKLYNGHIEACSDKRLVLMHSFEKKTIFLEHKTRESESYRRDVKAKLSPLSFKYGKFITLTTSPRNFAGNRTMMCNHIKKQWNQLRTALKRRYGDFRYLCVIEFTKSNLPHLHVVCDIMPKVSLKLLHGNWGRQGDFIHIKHIRGGVSACSYVLKYVTKAINEDSMALLWFYKIRSYTLSRNAITRDIFDQYEKIETGWVFVGSMKISELYALGVDDVSKAYDGLLDVPNA